MNYPLLIAEMLWHSDVYMSKRGRNRVEYMRSLNLIRQYFENYVISEGLMNYSHSKLAYTLTSRLVEISPKLIDCGVVYRKLYEQPTLDIMNDYFECLAKVYTNAPLYCDYFFTLSEMYIRLSRLIRAGKLTECKDWIHDMKDATMIFESDPRYTQNDDDYDTDSTLSSLSDINEDV